LWGDEIESLEQIDPLTGQVKQTYLRLPIYPKSHYVMRPETRDDALRSIENELHWWKGELDKEGKRIEAQRLWQRTMFDLESGARGGNRYVALHLSHRADSTSQCTRSCRARSCCTCSCAGANEAAITTKSVGGHRHTLSVRAGYPADSARPAAATDRFASWNTRVHGKF
jgi:hypothetical protein